MSFVSPLFVLSALLVAGLVCAALGVYRAAPCVGGRYQTIDGLRGYLAFFVFVHHACIWHFYLVSGKWQVPPSNLYTHLGQTSVSLFFMITGFLFYGKLLDNKRKPFDWPMFFVARLLRLGPLYGLATIVLLGLVVIESKGVLVDSAGYVMRSAMRLMLFTIPGMPDVNRVSTLHVTAGVNWSLPYEWYFYLSMPLLAFSRRIQVPWQFMLVGIAALAFAFANGAAPYFMCVFASGIAAAIAVRQAAFVRFATTRHASMLALAGIAVVVARFPTAYGYPQLVLLTIPFCLIAGGADLFGALRARASHALGELSYGVYLLHGMVLFVTFNYVLGVERVRAMSALTYWATFCAVVPVLLLIATLAFRTVELPGMRLTPRVMAVLRNARRQRQAFVPHDPLADPINRDTGGPPL